VPEESVPELLLLLFQIVPFIFSILLRISSPQFDSTWGNKLAEYENALDLDLDRDAHEWKYKHLTTYLYDQTSLESGLRLSLFYAAVLHLIALIRSAEAGLAVPLIALVALGYYLPDISDRFFQMGPEERNPDRYYNYYYKKDDLSTKTRKLFENRFLSGRGQAITPRITTVLIEITLLVSIVLLQLAPKRMAVYTSTLLILVVVIFGALLFPLRRS
jgi:hypothetical protein